MIATEENDTPSVRPPDPIRVKSRGMHLRYARASQWPMSRFVLTVEEKDGKQRPGERVVFQTYEESDWLIEWDDGSMEVCVVGEFEENFEVVK